MTREQLVVWFEEYRKAVLAERDGATIGERTRARVTQIKLENILLEESLK